MRAVLFALILVAVTAALAVPAARSEDLPIQAFYGEFEGRTLFPMGEPRNRELSVLIRPAGRFGFAVEWQTTIHKANKTTRRDQTLVFEPTPRTRVYSAALPSSDAPSPPDGAAPRVPGLAEGAPYAWARLGGRTLTVNVFTIEDDGDYVVQTYNRTLTDKGMQLEFMRVRDGHIEQQIKGNLTRVGG